jgi:predicted PurR-regulated permease PerM
VLVVSIYMLLDMPRLARTIDRRFPPQAGTRPLLDRMESAVAGYVRGQLLVSLIIGTSAGVGMWVLGASGALKGADGYAFLFGLWAGVTELIPYLGPILGAVPPAIYALFIHPIALVWVVLLFLFIHQVEGHVVVPNVMGSALRLHPLLIIFGLLAGAEIYGLPGIFVALPVLAAARAAWEFFAERVELEPWQAGGTVPVEVEVEPEPAATVVLPAAKPPDPPRAASG